MLTEVRSKGLGKMESDAKPLVLDVVAWAMNGIGSVGFIMVNKQLMSISGYGFGFASTLTGVHLAITALLGIVSNTTGPLALKYIPRWELFLLSLVANLSIAGTNLSLMLNSVEFYQISKLSMIPVVCVMDWIMHNKHYSREAKMSLGVVVIGIGACTVTEVKGNIKGFLCACVAAFSTSLQQIYMGSLLTKYSIGSFELLSKTAPIQAVTLLLLGPFIDYYLNGNLIIDYEMSVGALLFILLSYTLAVFCNISQYLCIGRFHSAAFHFLDDMETVCILILGWVLFDSSLTSKSILGVTVAVVGSVIYKWAVEVEKRRLSATIDIPGMENSLTGEESTLLKEGADTKPDKDVELGQTD